MHQTFYIDVDEEITSIVERVRKAHMDELVMVVPKGALLIQSIINLKLLKKEADNLGKEIIIVTQDKIGKLLIEKTGIPIEQRLEDVEGEKWENISEIKIEKEKPYIPEESSPVAKKNSKKRLEKIGSSDFFESEDEKNNEDMHINHAISSQEKKIIVKSKKNETKETSEEDEKILNKELVMGLGGDIKKNKTVFGRKIKSGPMDLIRNMDVKQKSMDFSVKEKKVHQTAKEIERNLLANEKLSSRDRQKKLSQEELMKDKKFEQFLGGSESFSNQHRVSEYSEKRYSAPSQKIVLPSKFWKFFIAFSFLVGIFALGLFLYLFLPKATVTVLLKTKSQSIDAEIKGDIKNTSIDVANKSIPAKVVSFTDEISKNFSSTGEKAATSRKARGTVTIYNEYSTVSQPLVATTRFLSADGKLFRLVSGVTIPGMTKTGADSKPGAVEVEVVADEAGESFNIGSTTFSIPGFQGSGNEKYSKFYAKSFNAMTGGGSGDVMARAVTEQDINSAKEKTLAEFNSSIKQKIKDQSGEEHLALDDAFSLSENNYKISSSIGDISDEFTVTLSAKINAIIFSEKDLKDIMKSIMDKNSEDDLKISEKTLAIDFGKSDANVSDGTILIRVHGNGKAESNIDLENLKKGILGKNSEELKAYLGTYQDFSNVEVEYWPSFMGEKIPIYESRTEVVLDNN
jgi:hypothetical protein